MDPDIVSVMENEVAYTAIDELMRFIHDYVIHKEHDSQSD